MKHAVGFALLALAAYVAVATPIAQGMPKGKINCNATPEPLQASHLLYHSG
jgi:hypothetical protein